MATSRKLAAEVKKNDFAALFTANNFTQVGPESTASVNSRADFALIYPVLDATMTQGTQLDDIIGE